MEEVGLGSNSNLSDSKFHGFSRFKDTLAGGDHLCSMLLSTINVSQIFGHKNTLFCCSVINPTPTGGTVHQGTILVTWLKEHIYLIIAESLK